MSISNNKFLTIEDTNELINDNINELNNNKLEDNNNGLNNINFNLDNNLKNSSNKKEKQNKLQQQHNFNVKKDIFTNDELNIKPETIFIKHSKIKNDELIKYNIIKYNIIPYKCFYKNCPTIKTNMWRRKPLYLILFRKNNIQKDCRPINLQLICPNCYCLEYGAQSFEKIRKTISKKCYSCNYPIKSDIANTTNYCYVCTKNIERIAKQYNHLHTNNDKSIKDLQKLQSSYENEVENLCLEHPELDLLSDLSIITNKNNNENVFEKYGFDETTYKRAMNSMISTESTKKIQNKPKYNYKNNKHTNNNTNNINTNNLLPDIKLNINLENNINLEEELNNI